MRSRARSLQMQQRQKTVRSQRAEEESLFALPVVDELSACTAMHPAWRFSQVIDLQVRPIFAETVGEDSIGECRATQIERWLPDCLHASEGLHGHFFTGGIPYCHLDCRIGALVINLHGKNQIGLALEPSTSDRYHAPRAEFILECRFGSLMARVLPRAQPLVINLRCHTAGEHGLAARTSS